MEGALRSGVEADLIVALGDALCPRGGSSTRSPQDVVRSCPDPQRRRELERLLARIDSWPPSERNDVVEAFDEFQTRSKLWLIDELSGVLDLGRAEMMVVGAWYGVLPLLCHLHLPRPPVHTLCLDVDGRACEVGERTIGALYPTIGYRCADAMTVDYGAAGRPWTVVVNTICEHLPDLPGWWRRIPPGQLVVLQSNDYPGCRDHVNWVHGLDEMKQQTPLSDVLFEGELPLTLFRRFMLIGRR
jgi:hypothetical protein